MYYLLRRTNDSTRAAQVAKKLDELPHDKSWRGSISQFINGRTAARKIIDSAKTDSERTAVNYYRDIDSLVKNQGGKQYFDWINDYGDATVDEFRWGVTEFTRLNDTKVH